MKSFDDMEFHPASEELVRILCLRTQNTDPMFFRIHVAYYMAMVASMMRCNIKTMDRGDIPVNLYAINLATSGSGKGHSTNVMEEKVLSAFINRFTQDTFPALALAALPKIANDRAMRKSVDPDEEMIRVQKEFDALGPLVVSFDSGTSPAVKQARHKLQMVKAGSMNLQMDEIGTNLTPNLEILGTFLELFDVGNIKQKLIKNTSDNLRNEDMRGRTPANMMLFGTPGKLLNGGKTEEEFYSLLDTGYARRCFYSYSRSHARGVELTPQEALAQRIDTTSNAFLEKLSEQFEDLADIRHVNTDLVMNEDVTLLFIEYEQLNTKRALALNEHDEMRKAEVGHRHFKALKLAGAYAFVDGLPDITEEHAYYAIKLAEESGKAFSNLLTRDRHYVKLAKYIAEIGRDVTQADLVEDLPFYRGSISQKQEMLQLATAYGYQHSILIKKSFNDGIEFLRGESLKVTDLSKIRVSYSTDMATDYLEDTAPWEDLHQLVQANGMHWCNHHLKGGHRLEENAIPGFNIVVIDVDHGVTMQAVQVLLKDYKALFYTTKRNTDEENRFRIIMPINFELALDAKDYKEFMTNLFEWLPFPVDTQTNQRARKWLSCNSSYIYQDGEVLDALPFIPKTTKNEERKRIMNDQSSLDNLERWVINHTGDGNRNNMILKYAMILVDVGFDFAAIHDKVKDLNDKLPDKLEEAEILGTVMVTVGKALSKR